MTTKLGRIESWTLFEKTVQLEGLLHKHRELVIECHAPMGALASVETTDGVLVLGEVVGYEEFSVIVRGPVRFDLESEHEAYFRTDDCKPTAADGKRLKSYREPYIERVRDPVMERYFRMTQRTMENMQAQQAEVVATLAAQINKDRKASAAEIKRLEDAAKASATKPVEGDTSAKPASGGTVDPGNGAK